MGACVAKLGKGRAGRTAPEEPHGMTVTDAGKCVYYAYTGRIDDEGATRIATALNSAVNSECGAARLSFNSLGGYVASGIWLYNHMRSLPLEIAIYNTGSVGSIAVTVFVGGTERYCSRHSMFMIHPTTVTSLPGMSWDMLKSSAESALADDERTERILRERTRLSDELLNARRSRDVHIGPGDALANGLVQGIAEFEVPPGVQVIQI